MSSKIILYSHQSGNVQSGRMAVTHFDVTLSNAPERVGQVLTGYDMSAKKRNQSIDWLRLVLKAPVGQPFVARRARMRWRKRRLMSV